MEIIEHIIHDLKKILSDGHKYHQLLTSDDFVDFLHSVEDKMNGFIASHEQQPVTITAPEEINAGLESVKQKLMAQDTPEAEVAETETETVVEETNQTVDQMVPDPPLAADSPVEPAQPAPVAPPLTPEKQDELVLQPGHKTIVLMNAKQFIEYKYAYHFADISPVYESISKSLETVGLTYDIQVATFTGKPEIAGEFLLPFRYFHKNSAFHKSHVGALKIYINPDPRTLVKNIPTPADIEYYKPDSDVVLIKGSGQTDKNLVVASQRGRSHAQEGKPRDDDFGVCFMKETGWYIMSVADGAGSAKSSRKGSEIACKTVIDVCRDFLENNYPEFEQLIEAFYIDSSETRRKSLGDYLYKILGTAVFNASKEIEKEAKLKSKPIKDYSTTLLVSICKKFSFGWFTGAFWVGDGGMGVYYSPTRYLKLLGVPDGGAFAGETRFLTMAEITQPGELYNRLRFDIVEDFTALILMSDGVTDPKFETDANLLKVEKWDELWMDLSKEVDFKKDNEMVAEQLLSWLDFWSPGNHDDRTIAILF